MLGLILRIMGKGVELKTKTNMPLIYQALIVPSLADAYLEDPLTPMAMYASNVAYLPRDGWPVTVILGPHTRRTVASTLGEIKQYIGELYIVLLSSTVYTLIFLQLITTLSSGLEHKKKTLQWPKTHTT
jgi:hypothetical protein